MAERLHYFTEASTPVSFDCSDSDIDSDIDDLSRRPTSDADRAKQHARQLQLWSDEARRRRSPAPAPGLSPRRRPSFVSLHDVLPPALGPPAVASPPKPAATELRRLSADRQQSNLSERARLPNSRRVSRSHSAKNLRIRITPSSSSKSLLSDIESELGTSVSASAPQSPRTVPADLKPIRNDKDTAESLLDETDKIVLDSKPVPTLPALSPATGKELVTAPSASPRMPDRISADKDETQEAGADTGRLRRQLSKRMSFHVRGKRLRSWRKLWRRHAD